MNFLQPWLLAALPLAALPIIIHLINQRRYQSVRWGAMMFLLAANRMSRGYARIRQWLILALRAAAIATLIFAVSRPLAGGWLGLTAGGTPDVTLVLLDRSPSMAQGDSAGSKRETALRQLAATLGPLGSDRWVLIESGSDRPVELESIEALVKTPAAGPADATADVPAMLMAARDYIRTNKPGRAEVWICSDLRAADWDADGGRWQGLRDAFLEFPQGIRFHLLAYPRAPDENLAVRVTDARLEKSGDGTDLAVTVRLARDGESREPRKVPLQFEIDGARSVVEVELVGAGTELKGHRIPIAKGQERGWGSVSIPADANPADNIFYFAHDRPAPRKAIVVADDPGAARPLALAASIPPAPGVDCSAEVVPVDALAAVEWDKVGLLLWQSRLPEGEAAELVESYVERGGHVMFLPPTEPDGTAFLGTRWTSWTDPEKPAAVENWRSDEDLLARTQSGDSLPVGGLGIRRSCGLEGGELTPLASLTGGAPLLARAVTDQGAVYFLATTPAPGDSTLAIDGVTLYVLVQRALAAGSSNLEATRQIAAGQLRPDQGEGWTKLAGGEEAVSTEYPIHAGVYADGDRLLAVNRPLAEDAPAVLADDRVAGLFRGLEFDRVDDRAGAAGSLIQEVWRLFLTGMLIFLVGEAVLCLPRKVARPSGAPAMTSQPTPAGAAA